MGSDQGNCHRVFWQSGFPAAEANVDGSCLRLEFQTQTDVYAHSAVSRVTGLQLGEAEAPDPSRPALILRRCGGRRLWDIAKSTGSTVESIRKANGLTDDPESDNMLLIPVI